MSRYEVFLAEFFLQKTSAPNVESVYRNFLTQYPSLKDLEAADEGEIRELIKPLGLQRKRSSALKQIAEDYDGIPDSKRELLQLPQVGRYVAEATLEFSGESGRPIVDANVDRVYRRVFKNEWEVNNKKGKWNFAENMLPYDSTQYNFALLDFGAKVCKPNPRCDACFATDYCDYYAENIR